MLKQLILILAVATIKASQGILGYSEVWLNTDCSGGKIKQFKLNTHHVY